MAVVILDSDQIPHGISRKFVKFPGEALDHYYNRVTHLHHQGTVNKIHSKMRFQIYCDLFSNIHFYVIFLVAYYFLLVIRNNKQNINYFPKITSSR